MTDSKPDGASEADEFAGLELVELLERLEDITQPSPPSYMPQTPGWWLVAALLLIVLALAAWRVHRWRVRNAYRREALELLSTLAPAVGAERCDEQAMASLASLLRRTALAAFPRQRVASLQGEAWLAFLAATGGAQLSAGAGRALVQGPYGGIAPSRAERLELLDAARHWIRRHRPEPARA